MTPVTSTKVITSAGTPVRVTATSTGAMMIYFAPRHTNTGVVYVGGPSMTRTPLLNVIKVMAKTDPGLLLSCAPLNALDPSDYWVDADTSGDKVIVTYWSI